MKFNHLKASVANNADQMPTLYMALCVVESLFSDLEEDCGREISRCPVGDERLPSKLVWLCRTINEIYQNNSDDLQRNRTRLDVTMEKMRETQIKLEAYSGVADQLASQKAAYAALKEKLRESSIAAEECEILAAKCDQAKEKLEVLRQFNPAAMKAALEKLTSEIAALESSKDGMAVKLAHTKEISDELQREVDRLRAEEASILLQTNDLKEQLYQRQKENARLCEERDNLAEDYTALKKEGHELIQTRNAANSKIAVLQEKIAKFREEDLAPKLAELDGVRTEYEGLEKNKNVVQQECALLKSGRNQLMLDIARQEAENEALNEKRVMLQKKLGAMKREKEQLDAVLSGCILELEVLQGEVEHLNKRKIPEVQELREQEQRRQKELLQSVEQAEQQIAVFKAEIRKLKELLPELEEDVKNNRVVYDALTANCTASTKELESLERQIAELRSNNAEEKLVIYRKQLEENQRDLESIQAECACIELENAKQQRKLEEGQNRRAKLLELKQRHESAAEVTEKQLRELEFVGTEKYVREVISLEERAKLLETVRGKLAAAIANMHQILGQAPIEENISLEEQLKHELREIRLRTDDLRCALMSCAKSFKMEER